MLKNLLNVFMTSSKIKHPFPTGVETLQIDPQDEEILEEWVRVCSKEHRDFYGVYAVKIADEEYPWQLLFSAGEYIREEPFASNLSQTVEEAILSVNGSNVTHHEDTEKFIVSGTVSGKEMIEKVSVAIDLFMKDNLAAWEATVKNITRRLKQN